MFSAILNRIFYELGYGYCATSQVSETYNMARSVHLDLRNGFDSSGLPFETTFAPTIIKEFSYFLQRSRYVRCVK